MYDDFLIEYMGPSNCGLAIIDYVIVHEICNCNSISFKRKKKEHYFYIDANIRLFYLSQECPWHRLSLPAICHVWCLFFDPHGNTHQLNIITD